MPEDTVPLPVPVEGSDALVPGYLVRTYGWAYLNPRSLYWFDRQIVVNTILWGQAARLTQAALDAFEPGMKVLQAACVYGDFSLRLAQKLGATGSLKIVDVAPVQAANARRKLMNFSHASVRVADLALKQSLAGQNFEGICCFFLLHEVPDSVRIKIVDNLLSAVKPGGRIVFVDYHKMSRWHPLLPVMSAVFHFLEPFAKSLTEQNITSISKYGRDFEWHQKTLFGGLFQIVLGTRRDV